MPAPTPSVITYTDTKATLLFPGVLVLGTAQAERKDPPIVSWSVLENLCALWSWMSCLHVNKKGHMNHFTGLGIELDYYVLRISPSEKKKKKSDFLSLSITKRPFFSNCISGKMVTWSLSAVFAPIWNMPFWITGNSKDILNQKILWSQCNVPNIVYIYLLWKCISIFVLVFWLMFSFQNPSNEKYRFKRKTDRRKKTPNILHNKEYIFIW